MLAAVYHGPNDLRIEEVSVPQIGAGEMLLKVSAASICGTDLRIVHGNHRLYTPDTVRIPGHEVVGIIEKVGQNVSGFVPGEKVFVAPNMGCGHCAQCVSGNNNLCKNFAALGVTMDGGFAEYVRIPEAAIQQGNVIRIGESVDEAVAALTEPFACVYRGQKPLHITTGEVVLVIGAGPIGVMHTRLAKARGAGKVIVSEPMAARAEQVKHLGADVVINPAEVDLQQALLEESNGFGADVIIVAAPVQAAQESALTLAAIGGRINYFGGLPKDRSTINFDSNLVHYKELIITATTACSTNDCWQAARILNSGLVDLSELVSQRYPLKDAGAAFAAAEDRKSLKIVLEP